MPPISEVKCPGFQEMYLHYSDSSAATLLLYSDGEPLICLLIDKVLCKHITGIT